MQTQSCSTVTSSHAPRLAKPRDLADNHRSHGSSLINHVCVCMCVYNPLLLHIVSMNIEHKKRGAIFQRTSQTDWSVSSSPGPHSAGTLSSTPATAVSSREATPELTAAYICVRVMRVSRPDALNDLARLAVLLCSTPLPKKAASLYCVDGVFVSYVYVCP